MEYGTKDTVEKLLVEGESVSLEIKLSLATKDNVAKAISAMANTHGGTVIVGIAEQKYYKPEMGEYTSEQAVHDEYIVFGVKDEDRDRRELAMHLRETTNLRSQIDSIYRAKSIKFRAKTIILIDVSALLKTQGKLVTYKGKAYRRLDNQSVSLNIDEVIDLLSAKGYDTSFVPTTKSEEPVVANIDEQLLPDAVDVIFDAHKASTSLLQRRLRIGYGRAARMLGKLEELGVVEKAKDNQSGPRGLLITDRNEAKNRLSKAHVEQSGIEKSDTKETMYELAVDTVRAADKASTSFLQRRLRIGYGRAAKLMSLLEENGVIEGRPDTPRARKVLTADANKINASF
jgi:ribosomal protein S25